ncbi:MAG: pseudouridine synthase [Pseudomonadales bacterium]
MTLLRFYKPFGVLSQFTDGGPDAAARRTLADYVEVPGVYPAGRLDRDSEGLLLLTDDGILQARIAEPRFKMEKVYWVQVEADPTPAEVARLADALAAGLALRDGLARANGLRKLADPDLPPRVPAVTAHRAARGSWLEVVLTSGRNRQVRRMLAALGLPVLRLHRAGIGPFDLTGLAPGEFAVCTVPDALRAPPGSGLRRRRAGR